MFPLFNISTFRCFNLLMFLPLAIFKHWHFQPLILSTCQHFNIGMFPLFNISMFQPFGVSAFWHFQPLVFQSFSVLTVQHFLHLDNFWHFNLLTFSTFRCFRLLYFDLLMYQPLYVSTFRHFRHLDIFCIFDILTFSFPFFLNVDAPKEVEHGQTLAYRTSLGPSLQLYKWLQANHALTPWCSNTT